MTSHEPPNRVDLPAITARHRAAMRSDGAHAALIASAADVPTLTAEVRRLRSELLRLRLAHANLRAAARAALAAHRDGDPESFAYLADELSGAWPATAHGHNDQPERR
jgi:hypothetical protein